MRWPFIVIIILTTHARDPQEWQDIYLQCDCIVIDARTVPLLLPASAGGPTGSTTDLDIVTLLRILSYKMVIAQLEDKNWLGLDDGLSDDLSPRQPRPPFDFSFNETNSSRAGLRSLEEACNKRAIGHVCWLASPSEGIGNLVG